MIPLNITEQNILLNLSKDNLIFHQKVFPVEGEKVAELIDGFTKHSDLIIYQSKPFNNTEYLAIGSLFKISAENFDLSKLDEVITNFRDNVTASDTLEKLPLFFGYAKFPSMIKENYWNNFKDNEWVIPQYFIFKKDNKLFCAQNFISDNNIVEFDSIQLMKAQKLIEQIASKSLNADSHPLIEKLSESDSAQWEMKVVKAIEEIRENKLQKIVLARKVEYKISGSVSWSKIFDKLNYDYPDCFNFMIKSGSDYFFGSSPELLGKFEKNIFRTEALAGSINRGLDEYEDTDLALLLSASKKNKKEHEIVIEHLRDNLQSHLFNIEIDETPLIKRLKNIQHLQTKITGKLKEPLKYFHLIKSIFPTPAICGIPTAHSLNKLKELEGFDRGLYSGIIGSFNLFGEADFFVAIRSALISEDKLIAFAGCGLVEESNPKEEFLETELKFQPIISLFTNED